jgi:hypothetical protein
VFNTVINNHESESEEVNYNNKYNPNNQSFIMTLKNIEDNQTSLIANRYNSYYELNSII